MKLKETSDVLVECADVFDVGAALVRWLSRTSQADSDGSIRAWVDSLTSLKVSDEELRREEEAATTPEDSLFDQFLIADEPDWKAGILSDAELSTVIYGERYRREALRLTATEIESPRIAGASCREDIGQAQPARCQAASWRSSHPYLGDIQQALGIKGI